MKNLVKLFGVLIVTCAIIGLPMLTVIAIAYGWDGFFCALFTMMTIFEAVCIAIEIIERVDN